MVTHWRKRHLTRLVSISFVSDPDRTCPLPTERPLDWRPLDERPLDHRRGHEPASDPHCLTAVPDSACRSCKRVLEPLAQTACELRVDLRPRCSCSPQPVEKVEVWTATVESHEAWCVCGDDHLTSIAEGCVRTPLAFRAVGGRFDGTGGISSRPMEGGL